MLIFRLGSLETDSEISVLHGGSLLQSTFRINTCWRVEEVWAERREELCSTHIAPIKASLTPRELWSWDGSSGSSHLDSRGLGLHTLTLTV